ncbi:hypothetical protein M569_05114 [Genlisea aurea]|uniref:GATA transcription factor n=1 Tax=Genlisea aurea TaxID=192259 RepID=S8CXC5_9LAMI|nr:hypothetical protein M569_05114 [Genlisea aurea]
MECFGTDYAAEFSSGDGGGGGGGGAHFMVDDLLDFSKEDDETFLEGTPVDSCNSSISGGGEAHFNGNVSCRSVDEPQFTANDLCVPNDDIEELEWLSNFVEESFSTDDLPFIAAPIPSLSSWKAGASSPVTARYSPPPPSIFSSDVSVPGKARSKRSRAPPCDWSSRLLHVNPSTPTANSAKKREPAESPCRKCLHCQSEKTPQWRTGPMGPKTLCNACGVRFKSGRLVPEYRPAASPTFVSNKHSNSHRKVLELRRQTEIQQQQQQLVSHVPLFNGCDGFLLRRHINGQDLSHVI